MKPKRKFLYLYRCWNFMPFDWIYTWTTWESEIVKFGCWISFFCNISASNSEIIDFLFRYFWIIRLANYTAKWRIVFMLPLFMIFIKRFCMAIRYLLLTNTYKFSHKKQFFSLYILVYESIISVQFIDKEKTYYTLHLVNRL